MLVKNIRAKLALKHESWIRSIDDENVRDAARNSFITGGAIVSLLNDEEPNDYDVYFTDYESLRIVMKYYRDKWNKSHGDNNQVHLIEGVSDSRGLFSATTIIPGGPASQYNYLNELVEELAEAGITFDDSKIEDAIIPNRLKFYVQSKGVTGDKGEGFDSPTNKDNAEPELDIESYGDDEEEVVTDGKKYRPRFISPNAVTLSDGIQLVLRFYGSPKEVHEYFDYVHCTNYWEPSKSGCRWVSKELKDTGELVLQTDALTAVMTKELRYVGSKYPLCSLFRLRKFLARGYTINAGQIIKISMQISNLNLLDPDVLEDQLLGVDTFYMAMFVTQLKKGLANGEEKIDSTYVAEVVDKIFDAK